MKAKARKILQAILGFLARRIIRKYRPIIIGITGSTGKSSTKEAVYAVFRNQGARANRGNLNNEFGLPLTVIGDYAQAGGFFFWLKVILAGFGQLIFRRSYPKLLILEYGADRPKDLDYLLSVARPHLSIITVVGKIPVHVEFYADIGEVIKEKAKLVGILYRDDFAVLNLDDEDVASMADLTEARIFTYGFDPEAKIRIAGFENRWEEGGEAGIFFNLTYENKIFPVKIDGVFGRGPAYAAAAAAAAGLALGLDFDSIVENLADYRPLPGRLRLLRGIKGTWLLDDSYNASPLSVHEALEALRGLPAKRKIVALGDMAELGAYTISSHEEIGKDAATTADFLVTVGHKARFIAEGARIANFSEENTMSFDSSEEAGLAIQEMIQPGDLILIKGSQAVRMEKIVLELMDRPETAAGLLVRQYGKWL